MGRAKNLLDELVCKKSNGDKLQVASIKIKLILKGIDYEKITDDTPDTDDLIKKIYQVAEQFDIELEN